MDFLHEKILDNTVQNLLIAVTVVLLAVLLNKIISRYTASLFYLFIKGSWKKIELKDFCRMFVNPLSDFITLTIALIALNNLQYPHAWEFTIYKVPFSDILEKFALGLFIFYFFRLLMSVVNFIALGLAHRASLTKEKSDDQLVVFFRDFIKVSLGIVAVLLILKASFNQNIGQLLTGLSIIGAALALVLYFVFRAGLLNFNDTSNINIYGIITLSAFAGLFTDKATMKLAEVFEVIFRTVDPKTGKTDIRPDNLTSNEVNLKITGIQPETLIASSDNKLIVSGFGLDKKKLIIKIDDDEIINPVIKNDSISLTYKIPEGSDKKEFVLKILDEKGNQVFTGKLTKSVGTSDTEIKVNDTQNVSGSIGENNPNPSAEEVDDENNSEDPIANG